MKKLKKKQEMKIERPNKSIKRKSLSQKIIWLYLLLAFINICFFSLMIYENQTDLLISNFKQQSKNVASEINESLKNYKSIQRANNFRVKDYEQLPQILELYDIQTIKVFEDEGDVIYSYPIEKKKGEKISEDMIDIGNGLSIERDTSVFYLPYSAKLNEKDFSINVFIPIQDTNTKKHILYTALSIKTIKDRLNFIYYQIAIALIGGIIFHVLFAIFVLRIFFVRLNRMDKAVSLIEMGNLDTRIKIDGTPKGGLDELDVLGLSFNNMAAGIQEKIETISKLNEQIRKELVLGRQVQESLLSSAEQLAELKPQVYYKAFREVSGDLYKYHKYKNNNIAIFFGDASGHGAPAALVTIVAIMVLEQLFSNKVSILEIPKILNNRLCTYFESRFYITSIFLYLRLNQKKLFFYNAGHLTCFVLPASGGERIPMSSKSIPMGVTEDVKPTYQAIQINKGDKIFIYSDGITDVIGADGTRFEEKKLLDILDKHKYSTGEEIHLAIKNAIEEFTVQYTDDVSYLIFEIP